MIITSIEPQRHAEGRYSVFIDKEFYFGLGGADLLYYKLEAGQEITAERLSRITEETVFMKARDKAISLLAFRQRSAKELRDRLKGGYNPEITCRVIDWLTENKYLDDSRYAEEVAVSLRNKGYSERAVRASLYTKGLGSEEIESAGTDEEYETALKALSKRYRDGIDPDDPADKRRAFAFLARRGFPADMCKRALESFMGEEELE